jgi:outer membrane biosynthesis protein TonB
MAKLIARTFAVCFLALTATLAGAQEFKPDPDWELQRHCTDVQVFRGRDGKVVWFSHEQLKRMATKKVTPEFPPLLRQVRMEGQVLVNVCIGPDSIPKHTWIVSGHPLLFGPALKAASEWRFKPYRSKEQPVAIAGTLRFTFSTSKGYGY